MGIFDIFKKCTPEPSGDGMNENRRYVYDTIVAKLRMGFISPGNLNEEIQDMVADEDLTADVSHEWIWETIEREAAKLDDEKYAWIRPTDPERLAQAFNELCAEKIIALHKAGYTTSDGEEDVVAVEWKLRDKGVQSEGYCFYHEQDLERAIDPDSKKLLIAFQKIDNSDEAVTRQIGQRVADKLRAHGFTVNWDGNPSQKIEIENINWNKIHTYADDDLYKHARVIKIMTQ